jgi:hypothetical protein
MKNEYRVLGETTIIYLNRRDGSVLECLIDTTDLELAKRFVGKWYSHRNYVCGNSKVGGKGTTIFLHSLILNTPKHLMVDHIDGNTLDNRRKNIRNVTQAQNNQNQQGAYRNNKSSGIRGVSWHKQVKKWYASVMVSGKQTYIGIFDYIAEAEKAVIEARRKFLPYSQEAL